MGFVYSTVWLMKDDLKAKKFMIAKVVLTKYAI
jgi:hypothetical protein